MRKPIYKLIMMDYSMPDCDGLEATRQIRKLLQKHSIEKQNQPHICLLTAYGDRKVKANAFEAGMDSHAHKPIFKN
jgi:CheY-like chemotaxis protein